MVAWNLWRELLAKMWYHYLPRLLMTKKTQAPSPFQRGQRSQRYLEGKVLLWLGSSAPFQVWLHHVHHFHKDGHAE